MTTNSEEGKKIQPTLSADQIHHVEAFVEDMCDQYNINNAYFGHMMFAVTEMFTQACMVSDSGKETIGIQFSSDRDALRFHFDLGGVYPDLASKCKIKEEILLNKDELAVEEEGFLAMELLCDDIQLQPDNKSIELVFNISSINKVLRNKRVRALENYYAGLVVQQRASS